MKQSVYISDLLSEKHHEFWLELAETLDIHGYEVVEIDSTMDIWCRDYMPVVGPNGYVKFVYELF